MCTALGPAKGPVWRREKGQLKLQQKYFCSCAMNKFKNMMRLKKMVVFSSIVFPAGFTGQWSRSLCQFAVIGIAEVQPAA